MINDGENLRAFLKNRKMRSECGTGHAQNGSWIKIDLEEKKQEEQE